MALVGHISGSVQSNSVIGISGSVIIANEPSSRFPQLPGSDIIFFVSGSKDGTGGASFGGDIVVSGSSKHLSNVQVTGSLLLDGSLVDLQATNVNVSTTKAGTINLGAVGNANDVIVAGDGKIQLLSDIGGSPTNNPPAGSIQILAGGVGGVGFNPAGGEIVIESTNGFTVNTNGDMTLQMNSTANETLNIFASNAFSSTPNIQIRSDGSNASNSIDITSHNGGGISIGSNSSYDTGDILIGQKEYQRTIRVGNVSTVDQYVIIGSEYGSSYTAVSGSLIVTGDMTVKGTTTTINSANTEIRDALLGLGYASGSVAESNGDRGIIGGLAAGDDVAMFWDNSASEFVVARTDSTPGSSSVNITSYSNLHVNVLTGSAVTGSLTKLSDGSDYLRAGSNISLTTGSLGQVTIAVAGLTSGDVVGPASATNDAIAVYDGTTGKLIKNSNLSVGTRTTTQNYVTASVNLMDYGLALIPSGTGPLSANAPDGTSVGGNSRGTNSTDWQRIRTANTKVASGVNSTIGGGYDNTASGVASVVAGGESNSAPSSRSAVVGGQGNSAGGNYSFVGGGSSNSTIGEYATISGGSTNGTGLASYSFVGGGQLNTAFADASAIAGGQSNSIQSLRTHASIGGGQSNSITGAGSHQHIGGGQSNVASSIYVAIVGGLGNLGSGQYSSIVGGQYNTGSGNYSSVLGGINNTAQSYGETSFGLYATTGAGSAASYVSTDRLLSIGNGTSTSARSNALTLIKNGNMHLSGTLTLMSGSTSGITFPTTRGTNGQVLTSDGAGLITWQTPVSQLSYFSSTTAGSIYTTGSTAFVDGEIGIDSPSDKGSDVWFYVSGSTDGTKSALFGGNVVTSGSLSVFGNTTLGNATSDLITFNARAGTDFLPANDNQYNLGSASNRWANVYTGDLHLKNDRGDWTVIEEDEYLSLRNNKTGKLYRLVMEPVGE